MRKELRRRKDERLSDWCVRIALWYSNRTVNGEELCEVLKELSKKSYIEGTNDSLKAIRGK